MKIAVLGTGNVGQAIASKLSSLGHDVTMGTRNVKDKLESTEPGIYGSPSFAEWYSLNNKIVLGTFADATSFAEIIFNCTLGLESINILKSAGENNLNGKILIDIANPLDFSQGMPPSIPISNTTSLAEEIQKAFPSVKVVKALNTMYGGLMVNPAMVNGGDHSTFICGNDNDAKEKVKNILTTFGWMDKNILDLGDITTSRGPEMYVALWVRIYGATNNGAFNIKVVS